MALAAEYMRIFVYKKMLHLCIFFDFVVSPAAEYMLILMCIFEKYGKSQKCHVRIHLDFVSPPAADYT